MTDLFSIFVDVLAPVFLVVGAGFLVGRRLDLDPRPLARIAYYVFVPAFVFDVLVTSELAGATPIRCGPSGLRLRRLASSAPFPPCC